MENGALPTLLRQHAPTWLVHLPSLIDPPEREELHRQLAGTGQERMLRELAQALEILTAERPLVLWLEDLHWSDQATLALLAALARRPDPARLMILATYRPGDVLAREHRLREAHQELQLHGYCQELALGFLSEAIGHLTRGRELLQTLADTPERAQRELSLQLTLGTALMATRGFASPEAAQAYNRARELCRQVNDSRQLGPVLWGLRTYYNGRAEFSIARELAEQLLALAQRLEEPALLVEAHRALGNTLWFQGEAVAAHEHFAQGSALYDVRQHRSLALLYENDPGVGCLSFAAVALWNLGCPDRARHSMQEALQLAQDVAHPGSQAMSLALSAALHLNRREVRTVRDHAEALTALARKQGFSGWLATGTIYRGWALAQHGQAEEGVKEIRLGLMTLHATGIELNRPRYLMMLAEACAQAGKPAEGLTALGEALAVMERTGGRLYEVELYRLQGELALQQESQRAKVKGQKSKIETDPRPPRRSRSLFPQRHRHRPKATSEVS